MRNAKAERTIAQFEKDLLAGLSPHIDDFLVDADDNDFLFRELLHIDIELRLRRGEPARVESYLKRFPQLANHDELIGGLVETEFRTRQQFDPDFEFSEYVMRFPVHYARLVKNDSPQMNQLECRKIRLHQQGGLGNLWQAKDTTFGRKVALKEIKSKFRDDDLHEKRFLREAYLTAFMQHPGIVPVYGHGKYADGSQCYSMRFVEGRSFQEVISQVHDDIQRPFSRQSIELRRLLRHFIDCCNTISYAHAVGVIHGDIKPGNIMIGEFGETIVVDWGLAHLLPVEEITAATPAWRSEMENSLQQFAQPTEAKESEGQTVGSPAFMSPEQQLGGQNLGVRTDIYSLGATLCCVVGNIKNPNKQIDRLDAVGRHKDLKPLLSICRKAMHTDPERRYDCVNEMVLDIENYLADQSVSAHIESIPERLNRNSRRYRAAVNTALIAMSLVAGISILSAFWINHERQNAVTARNDAVRLKTETEEALKQVTQTKSKLETQFRQHTILLETLASSFAGPGSCTYGKELTIPQVLDRMVADAKLSDDELTRGYLAGMEAKRAFARLELDLSVNRYRESNRLLSQTLGASDPIVVEYRLGLATSLIAVASEYNPNTEERKSGFAEAREIVESILSSSESGDQITMQLRYLAMTALPSIHLAAGEGQKAIDSLAAAAELGKQCYAEDDHHYMLLRLLTANTNRYTGQAKAAEEELKSLTKDLETTIFADIRAKAHRELAQIAASKRNFAEAKKQMEIALQVASDCENFGKGHPFVHDIETLLLNYRIRLGERKQVKDHFASLWQQEVDNTSAGSRRAALAAFSYVNLLKLIGEKDCLKECEAISQTTLEAIKSEDTNRRIPPLVISRFKTNCGMPKNPQ